VPTACISLTTTCETAKRLACHSVLADGGGSPPGSVTIIMGGRAMFCGIGGGVLRKRECGHCGSLTTACHESALSR
jgi:hypothetical protein